MFMRFFWGLGVGHRYSHNDAPEKSAHSNSNQKKKIQVLATDLTQKAPDMDSSILEDCFEEEEEFAWESESDSAKSTCSLPTPPACWSAERHTVAIYCNA